MDIYSGIDELIAFAESKLLLDELDVPYARNRLLAIMGLDTYAKGEVDEEKIESLNSPDQILEEIIDALKLAKLADDQSASHIKARIMNALSYKPSQVNDLYADLGGKGVKKADDFLAEYTKASGFGSIENPAFEEKITEDGWVVACKGTEDESLNDLFVAIEELIQYAINNLLLDEFDIDWARREVANWLGINSYSLVEIDYEKIDAIDRPDTLIAGVINAAKVSGVVGELSDKDEKALQENIMCSLSLNPSEINDLFSNLAPKKAMDFLYDYSIKNYYIKKTELEKNIRLKSDYTKGGLEIVINKSNSDINGGKASGDYPKCGLCIENEGFTEAGKANLRTVRLELGGKEWFWQFAPYGSLGRHGIAISLEHTPLCVTKETVVQLMDFVDKFPHMFIGCEAALSGAGAKGLNHNHFLGGDDVLPIHKAQSAVKLSYPKYPLAEIDVLKWYTAAIRVTSQSRQVIAEIVEDIRNGWENFSAPAMGIIAKDEKGKHNALSLSMRKIGNGRYCLDIIPRSDVTSAEYPNGVFATHPDCEALKSGRNGLLEAQGYFVLPAIIEEQMAELNDCLVNKKPLPVDLAEFTQIYKSIIKENGSEMSKVEASIYIKSAFSSVCEKILGNISVFKTPDFTAAFLRDRCNCVNL